MELFEGDSAVYIIAITQSGAQLRRIDKADYNNTRKQYLEYISNPSGSTETSRDITLWPDIVSAALCRQTLPRGRIIVSPDGRYFL